MEIKVWTTPACVQCEMTKKTFTKLGIAYTEESLADNPEQLEAFKAQGYLQAPIVQTDIKTWTGFRLDKIKSLANFLFGEERHK